MNIKNFIYGLLFGVSIIFVPPLGFSILTFICFNYPFFETFNLAMRIWSFIIALIFFCLVLLGIWVYLWEKREHAQKRVSYR